MRSLDFPNTALQALRAQLLAEAPNEAAAVLLCGRSASDERTRLLVREAHKVDPPGYRVQETLRAIVDPSFIVPLLKRARLEGWSIALVHTHPFADQAIFSHLDDQGERTIMPVLLARADSRPHAALLLARSENAARLWNPGSDGPVAFDRIMQIGPEIDTYRAQLASASISERFDRSVRAFGKEGQAALALLKVAIVGLGGLGSIVAEQLAHLGVQHFLLIDPDVLEPTNLNRVIGAALPYIGKPKVDVTERMIRRIMPDAQITATVGDVTTEPTARALLDAQFVFCCTDSHGSRAVLNQIAYQYLIPTIDLGVRIDVKQGKVDSIVGRVQMLAPGLPCLVCQNLLDSEEVRRDLLTAEQRAGDPYIVGAAEPQPAVVSLNGTVASLGVTMMLSAVTGLTGHSRHQLILFDRGIVRSITSTAATDCVVCSLRGALARGDLWPLPGRPV